MYERGANSGSKAGWYRDVTKIHSFASPPEMKLISSGLMGKKQLHLSLSASEWDSVLIWLLLLFIIIYFNSGVFSGYLLIRRLKSTSAGYRHDDDYDDVDSINNNPNYFLYLMGSSAHLVISQSSTVRSQVFEVLRFLT